MKRLYMLLLGLVSLTCSAQSSFAPRVTTYPTVARGVNFALGRLTTTLTAASIAEQGFCYSSTNPSPTIADSLSSDEISYNGTIYRMSNLKPQTFYYVRAYVKDTDGNVGYGKVVKIATLKESNTTYKYANNGSADQNTRIDNALKDAVGYYHKCTNIQGYNINCTYNSGVATADCSYGGTIRVGSNSSYQATGTLLHEMNHGVGVGQHWRWYNCAALRAGTSTGNWLGERATALVRFFDNDETSVLKGDTQHMWPYGINGASEDNHTEILYLANAMITQAVGEDGLPAVSGMNASPCYTFDQTDGVKYYLKGECPGLGLEDGYLTEDENGKIVWKTVTGPEVLSDDAYAWYITFSPKAEYYNIQNVKTGHYMSGQKSGNDTIIAMTEMAEPGYNQRMQLLASRKTTTVTGDGGTFEGKAYWFTYPEYYNWTYPPTLQAEAGGATQSTTYFEFGNSNTNQRWLILDSTQVDNLDYCQRRGGAERLENLIAGAKEMQKVQHIVAADSIDTNFEAAIAAASDFLANPVDTVSYTVPGLALQQAIADFLASASVTDKTQPFDITFMIQNPTFDHDAYFWETEAEYNSGVGEIYATKSTIKQTLDVKMPMGDYRLTGQGFVRPGNLDKMETGSIFSQLYAITKNVKLMRITDDASDTQLDPTDICVDGKYIPDTAEGAAKYFAAGKYVNTLDFTLTAKSNKLYLGTKTTIATKSHWTVSKGYHLYAYGNSSATSINEIPDHSSLLTPHSSLYNLSGHKVSRTAHGLYIQNGKKIYVK